MKAHSLKGAAGNISADNLHLAAEALEKACVDGDISKIRPLLDTVTEKLQEVFNSSGLLDSLFVKTKA